MNFPLATNSGQTEMSITLPIIMNAHNSFSPRYMNGDNVVFTSGLTQERAAVFVRLTTEVTNQVVEVTAPPFKHGLLPSSTEDLQGNTIG